MGQSLKLYLVCLIRGIFSVRLSKAYKDIDSTDRDKMIKKVRSMQRSRADNQKQSEPKSYPQNQMGNNLYYK